MNHTVLIGRLTKDPELRLVASGQAVVNFTIAADRKLSKEKKAEAQAKGQPTADFIRIIAWGKTAELCANYLSKGRSVAVQGSIQSGTYKTNTGETRYTTEVLANKVEFIGENKSTGNQGMTGGGSEEGTGNYYPDDFQDPDFEEDIPF